MNDLDELNIRHFEAIAAEVESRVGIKLPLRKRTMVEGRLRRRVRALGLDSLNAYGAYLFDHNHLADELSELIDCVTTNKTDFFREPSHFDFLREVAIPELARQRGKGTMDLKIWSSACSTGAEAYTIAMTLQEMVQAGRPLRYSILGTDVSTEVLREARRGIYPRDFVSSVPLPLQRRYLMRTKDPAQQIVRIVPELRRKTSFEHLNLMDGEYRFDRDVDVIFCRNVLIYFDKATQNLVVDRLAGHLRPGGYLILGHSESMAGSGVGGLQQIRPTIFRRDAEAVRDAA